MAQNDNLPFSLQVTQGIVVLSPYSNEGSILRLGLHDNDPQGACKAWLSSRSTCHR